MGVLFFEDYKGNLRLVNLNVTEDTVHSEISSFVNKLNPNFHIYYIRSWNIDEDIIYDVGSHTEFFILKNKCCANCKNYLGGGDFGTCCKKDYGLWYDENYCDKWEEDKKEI